MRELRFGAFTPNVLQKALISFGHRLPNNFMGKRLSSFLRSILKRTAKQPIDLIVLGQKMRLHPKDNSTEKKLLVSPHFFDPEELSFIKTIFQPNFVFFDIGANVGTYSLFVALNTEKSTQVLSFEPIANIYERLKFNLEINNLKNVKALCCAIGEDNKKVHLKVGHRNFGASSVNPLKNWTQNFHEIEVDMYKLLDVVLREGVKHIDLLKIDIEGYEDKALTPFFREAPRELLPKVIIIEDNTKDWREDLYSIAHAKGYRDTFSTTSNNRILKLN